MTDSALPIVRPSRPVLSEVRIPAFASPLARISRVNTELARKVVNIRLAPTGSIVFLIIKPAWFASTACYVIEASALGSHSMLDQLQQVFEKGIAGADSFFRGRRSATATFWKQCRAALDFYGDSYLEQVPRVAAGALSTFEAIGLWMRP